MRKLVFLPILLCSVFSFYNSAMAGTCGATYIDYDGFQDADDDEFIYQYYGVYTEANSNKDCKDGCTLKKGKVWECDDQFCTTGKLLFTDTPSYTWTGNQQPQKTLFKCYTSGEDKWKKMGDVLPCTDIPSGKQPETTVNGATGLFQIGLYGTATSDYCYATAEQMACLKDPHAEWNKGVCSCRTPENAHSYRWDSKKGKCVEAGAATGGCNYKGKRWPVGKITGCPNVKQNANAEKAETICNANGTVTECKITCPTARPKLVNGKCVSGSSSPNPTNPTASCRAGRTKPNGKACCDTGNLGIYDEKTDTCTCANDLEFVIENGTGYCRAKAGTPTFTCPAAQLTWVANLKISCSNNTEVQSKIEMIENYCNGTSVSEMAFNEYITQLMDLSARLCGATSDEQKLCDKISDAHMIGDICICDDKKKELNRATQSCEESAAAIAQREQEAARTRITSISSNLSGLKAGLKTSVWKNKEGNFNTSRLVSDSVAGVVLGTAGGLITSNVIKKNQIKGGFEDIKCTIRGQVVADYADEFQVGIQ